MAIRTTSFPEGRRIRAFRGVEDVLKEDPTLLAAGVNVRSWDGQQPDFAEVASGHCPLIRLAPEVLPNQPITQAKSMARFAVKVEAFVAGSIAEDIVNFWDAIEAAMVRTKPFRDTNVECYLKARCGSVLLLVTEPGFGSWSRAEPPDQGLAGIGRINVSFLTNA